MSQKKTVQDQIEAAIQNDRQSQGKKDSKRALIIAFVFIPSVVILAAIAWEILARIIPR